MLTRQTIWSLQRSIKRKGEMLTRQTIWSLQRSIKRKGEMLTRQTIWSLQRSIKRKREMLTRKQIWNQLRSIRTRIESDTELLIVKLFQSTQGPEELSFPHLLQHWDYSIPSSLKHVMTCLQVHLKSLGVLCVVD